MMEFHPYAESYPLLEGPDLDSLANDILANGCREPMTYRMVKGKKQGLDGRNRLRACEKAGVKPPMRLVNVQDDAVEAYIDSLNLHRRHLTPAQRKARVAQLHKQGKSQHDIAEELGVGVGTVNRDIAESEMSPGVPFGTPEEENNGETAGRDGKKYSRKPKEQKLCQRCKIAGPARECPDCAELNMTKAQKAARDKKAKAAAKKAERDQKRADKKALAEEKKAKKAAEKKVKEEKAKQLKKEKANKKEKAEKERLEKQKQAAKEREDKRLQNGAEKFVYRDFQRDFGVVVRWTDRLANAYGAKKSAEHDRCNKILSLFLTEMEKWYSKLTTRRAPSHMET